MSPHRRQAALATGLGRVGSITAILKAALVDIDAGVIATVADAARGEVFDDFLEHADQCLRAGRGSCGRGRRSVFEDTMRRACTKRGIPEKGVALEQLIVALNKRNFISDPKAKRARVAGESGRRHPTLSGTKSTGPTSRTRSGSPAK